MTGFQAAQKLPGFLLHEQVVPGAPTGHRGSGTTKWPQGFGAGPAFSGLAWRKPWYSRLLSSLIPDRMWLAEPEGMLIGIARPLGIVDITSFMSSSTMSRA